jgi:two-component system, NtrC family, sensor kinase
MEPTGEAFRLLCVDDEKNVLRSIQRLFLDEDVEILIAESGAEGLEILDKTEGIQLVMSDYRMPEMNGVEFLKDVYKRWPDTVRIVLSGYADTASVVSAINEGHIYKFIPKPWNDDELKVTIFNAMERYSLQKRNRELALELKHANDDLQRINQNLEALVEDRTRELSFQVKALRTSQNILNTLPVAVIGMDGNGLIVQLNSLADRLFSSGLASVLGSSRHECLPEVMNEAIDNILKQGEADMKVNMDGKDVLVMANAMKFSGGQEVTICVLIPEGGSHE